MIREDRFVWQSVCNPLETDAERPLIWLLESPDGGIVGHNSLLKYPLKIGGSIYTGYCSTNLIVKPGTEGRGIGHKLIANNENLGGIAFAVGITPAATRAFQKRGWVLITDARMHAAVVHPYRALCFLRKPPWQAFVMTPAVLVINALSRIFSFLVPLKQAQNIVVREIYEFKPAWDDIWRQALRPWAIHFERRADFLNYKYFQRRDVKHTVILFERDDRPVGYAVYRISINAQRKIKLGRIVDLIYSRDEGADLLSLMVQVVIRAIRKAGVDCVVAIASSPEMARTFRRQGMTFSRRQPAIMKETDFTIGQLRDEYSEIWHITLGDSDMDNYW